MKLKRIFSAVLAGALCLSAASLTSCRKQTVEKSIVDHVYRVTTLEKPEGMTYPRKFFRSGDRVYLSYRYRDTETNESVERVVSMALDGTDLKETAVPALTLATEYDEETNTSYYLSSVVPAEDGTFWRTLSVYWYDPETYDSEETYYLQRVQADGTEIFSIDASTYWGEDDPDSEETVYHYIDSLTVSGDCAVFVDNTTLICVNAQGELQSKVDLSGLEVAQSGWLNQMLIADGKPTLMYIDYSTNRQQYTLVTVDIATSTLSEPVELDTDQFSDVWNFYAGEGYTFYYSDDAGMYGYDLATGESTFLMDFLNSDVTSNAFSRVIFVSPDTFLTTGYDYASGEYEVFLMERVPEEEIVPKYILTAAIVGSAWNLRNDVIRFNRQSDEYRIQIKTYDPDDYYVDNTAEYNYTELKEKAISALNTDIVAGQIPDILAVTSDMSLDSYISKGIFADLYTYLDKDERFSREDYLTNIFDAFAVNGKLYQMPVSFSVQSLIGKKSTIGDRDGWTMEEFIAWANSLPETSSVFYDATRDDMLSMFCTYVYDDFVDADTGKCSFDSEEFKMVLEYVKNLATESIWNSQEGYDENFWQEYEYRFRDDRAMLETAYVSYFGVIPSMMNYTFYTNDDLVLVGMPAADRNGSAINAETCYAISAQSLLVDGAWEFVSYFLTEEYQDSTSYFPILISSLEKKAAEELEDAEESRKRYEEDENIDYSYGVMVATEVTVDTVAGEEYDIVEETEVTDTLKRVFLTQEMVDEMMDFLKSLTHVTRSNSKVYNIITEEASAYFADQKSLEETVKLIQNRVSILVAESR